MVEEGEIIKEKPHLIVATDKSPEMKKMDCPLRALRHGTEAWRPYSETTYPSRSIAWGRWRGFLDE